MALGVLHPDLMDNVLTARQMLEWEIYSSLEPFGEQASWMRMSILACLYHNSKVGKGKKAQIKDFMPEIFAGKEEQTEEEMKGVMNTLMTLSKLKEKYNG